MENRYQQLLRCAELPEHRCVIEVHALTDEAVAVEQEEKRGSDLHGAACGGMPAHSPRWVPPKTHSAMTASSA